MKICQTKLSRNQTYHHRRLLWVYKAIECFLGCLSVFSSIKHKKSKNEKIMNGKKRAATEISREDTEVYDDSADNNLVKKRHNYCSLC